MRTTLLIFLLSACGNNNTTNQTMEDMSVAGDLSVGPDQGTMGCDLIAQDCGTGQKCAVSGFGMTATTACVMAGTAGEGMACTRTMGMDNCAAGLTCARGAGVCRKYCESNSNCLSGQKCGAGRAGSIIGTCAVPCTPFGTDCGSLNCSSLATAFGSTDVFFTCRMPGTTANFDDCTGGGICGPNAFCDVNAGWCAPLCDNTHACPALSGDGGVAVSCMSLATGMSGDPGFCAQ
jgi:hypothetical protein